MCGSACASSHGGYCMKTILIRIACILFFLSLLLEPQLAVAGASAGLLLWYQTVLPTLLPAMILSDLLLRIQADIYLTRWLHRPLEKLFCCSRDGAYAVLIGLLTGYPMGVKTAQSLYDSGRISSSEAIHLMHFCNQPSPMFLIGYVSLRMISLGEPAVHRRMLPLILLSVYGSAWICCRLSHLCASGRSHPTDGLPLQADMAKSPQKTTDISFLSLLEQSMMTSFEVMVKIGGYMILFSILEAYLGQIPLPSQPLRVLISGGLEMTTGIQTAAGVFSGTKAAAFCCMIVSFGGLSGYAQTRNVMSPILNRRCRYLSWKLLQGILAYVLSLFLSTCGSLILRSLLPG